VTGSGEVAALFVETNVAARLHRRLALDAATGCLSWTGYRNSKGYGTINVGGTPRYAHRVAWELANGPLPGGKCVLHRCDNPSCCNPRHLFLGSRADNNADMREKGRARQGIRNAEKSICKHGHPLTGANVRERNGRRVCRTCARLWTRSKRERSE
jgi:hypothetical protein